MTDVPILQAGDYIHVQSPLLANSVIASITESYRKHAVIVEEWTQLPDAHLIKIVAIFRPQPGKDPLAVMQQFALAYPPGARAR